MALRDVISNIEEKGVQETHKIYLCRKYRLVPREELNLERRQKRKTERQLDKTRDLLASVVMGLLLSGNIDKETESSTAIKKITSAVIMKGIMETNGFEEEDIRKVDDLLVRMSQEDPTSEEIKEWDKVMISLESSKYKERLKRLFVKEIIPSTYKRYASEPVADKVIIMESGKSPSTNSKHIGKELQRQGKYEVKYIGLLTRRVPTTEFYLNAVSFVKELSTAKALFLSTANDFLSYLDVRPETKVIQLWHGVGAFKHVGRSNMDNPNFGKSRVQWEEYDSYRNYTCVTTAAEGQRWIFEDAMGLSSDKILPIGISRTDMFFDDSQKKKAYKKLCKKFPQIEGKRIILYAPTFRGEVANAMAPDQLDVEKMNGQLSDEFVLLIKHHGLSKNIPPIPEGLEGTFAFDMNSNKILDIEQLLLISDILITDYSSVAFEFAITERPMAFFTYDLEDYIEQRGLYFDFYKDAPGPVCKSTDELIDFISNAEALFDKDRLMAFKNEYVSACDGHSTERTIALIESDVAGTVGL